MKVEVIEKEYCMFDVLYEADPDVVSEKFDEAFNELLAQRDKLAVPGFRVGKAPDYAIKARCKERIKQYVAYEMKTVAYDDMVFETDAKPIGYPQFDDISVKISDKVKSFTCKMTVLKKPDFELGDYASITVEEPEITITEESVKSGICAKITNQFAEMIPYEENDVVQNGDQITIEYKSFINGDEADVSEGIVYTVGENALGERFDPNLIGMKAGESKTFAVDETVYELTVHMGLRKKVPELTEEMVINSGFQSMEEFNNKIAQLAVVQIDQARMAPKRKELIQKLVDMHDFEIPKFLLEQEAQWLAMQQNQQWKNLNQNDKNSYLLSATDNVKLSLILDSIRDQEPDAVLNDSEVENTLKQRVAAAGQDPEAYFEQARRNGTLIGLVSSIKDEYTVQWLIKQTQKEEEK